MTNNTNRKNLYKELLRKLTWIILLSSILLSIIIQLMGEEQFKLQEAIEGAVFLVVAYLVILIYTHRNKDIVDKKS